MRQQRKCDPVSLEPRDVLEQKQQKLRRSQSRWRMLFSLLGTAAAVFLIFGVILGIGIVNGGSMYPSFRDGDIYLFERIDTTCKIGDVIVFQFAAGDYRIKRVVGVAGDVLSLDADGNLLCNGQPSSVEVFYETDEESSALTFPYTVAEGTVVVMGDKRDTSVDSRESGPVQISAVKGKVLFLFRASL